MPAGAASIQSRTACGMAPFLGASSGAPGGGPGGGGPGNGDLTPENQMWVEATVEFEGNTWMNAAFVYNPGGKTGIVWRYSHNDTPGSWSYARVVNDFEPVLEDVPPRVVYSPGAAGSGGGGGSAISTTRCRGSRSPGTGSEVARRRTRSRAWPSRSQSQN